MISINLFKNFGPFFIPEQQVGVVKTICFCRLSLLIFNKNPLCFYRQSRHFFLLLNSSIISSSKFKAKVNKLFLRIGKSKTLIQKQHTLKEFNALFLVKERFVICVSFSVLEIGQKLHIILFTYMKVFQSILPDPLMTIQVGFFFKLSF